MNTSKISIDVLFMCPVADFLVFLINTVEKAIKLFHMVTKEVWISQHHAFENFPANDINL